MRLKILSLNVRGLGTPTKRNLVSCELSLLKYDIFFLEETHISCKLQAELFERLWRGSCFWSFGTASGGYFFT